MTDTTHAQGCLGGDYYSKIVQLDDGRIRVGSHFFGRRKEA